MPDLDDWAALGDAIERDLRESNDAVFLRGAVHRLRERLATLTTERDRLRDELAEQLSATRAVDDLRMREIGDLTRERDAAQALLVEEQRDHAATRKELAQAVEDWALNDASVLASHSALVAELERQRPVIEAAPIARNAIEALRMLVELKDGPRDEAYYRAKDSAWTAARVCLRLVDRNWPDNDA